MREDIRAIRDATRRMATNATQFLELVRTRFEDPQDLRLSDIVRRAEPLVRALAGDQVVVTVRCGATRDLVRVDANQLQRALLALVANAADAMPDGGTLAVETFDIELGSRGAAELAVLPGPYAAVSVTDSGYGMSEDTRARAFEPFFTTRPGPEHAGLGLTSALLTASHYGGTIRLESTQGRGTTATIYLPLASPRRAAAPTAASSDPSPLPAQGEKGKGDGEVVPHSPKGGEG